MSLDSLPSDGKIELENRSPVEKELIDWLTTIGCERYAQIFIEDGCDSLKNIQFMTEEDLIAFGVKRFHRRAIFAALQNLQLTPTSATTKLAAPQDEDIRRERDLLLFERLHPDAPTLGFSSSDVALRKEIHYRDIWKMQLRAQEKRAFSTEPMPMRSFLSDECKQDWMQHDISASSSLLWWLYLHFDSDNNSRDPETIVTPSPDLNERPHFHSFVVDLINAALRGTPLRVEREKREPFDEAWPDFRIFLGERMVGDGEVKKSKSETTITQGLGQCLSYTRAQANSDNLLEELSQPAILTDGRSICFVKTHFAIRQEKLDTEYVVFSKWSSIFAATGRQILSGGKPCVPRGFVALVAFVDYLCSQLSLSRAFPLDFDSKFMVSRALSFSYRRIVFSCRNEHSSFCLKIALPVVLDKQASKHLQVDPKNLPASTKVVDEKKATTLPVGGLFLQPVGVSVGDIQTVIKVDTGKMFRNSWEFLSSLHNIGFVHRDISVGNILMVGEVYVVNDYEVIALIGTEGVVGTAEFRSPCAHDGFRVEDDLFSLLLVVYAVENIRAKRPLQLRDDHGKLTAIAQLKFCDDALIASKAQECGHLILKRLRQGSMDVSQ